LQRAKEIKMAELDCGVNWFSGAVDRDEIIVDPRLTFLAFMLAQSAALIQTWKEMMEHYDLPCPEENCPNKFGEYGLHVTLSTNGVYQPGTQNVVKVEAHCKVEWVLKVYCSKKVVAVPGPIAGDYEKLREEYIPKLPKR
jgi:hypothetical protein